MTYAFLITALLLIAATVADVRYTSRGLAKRLAVEGNSWIVAMYSNKPTPVQLYTANALFSAPMIASGVLGLFLHNYALLGLSIGPMVAYSLKHIHGARSWSRLGA